MADDKTFLALKKDFDNLSTAVNSAKTTADSALSKANTAQSTADSANSTATLANNAANTAETNSAWRYNDAINKINAKANINNPSFNGESFTFEGAQYKSNVVLGYLNTVTSTNNVIIGHNNTSVTNNASFLIGSSNKGAFYGFAFGNGNEVMNQDTYAIGKSNKLSKSFTIALGVENEVKSSGLMALGYGNLATHSNGVAIGRYCKANYSDNVVLGSYNKYGQGFIIGNGTSDSERSNSFRVDSTGAYALGAYHTSGADYAEYFEWQDNNLNNEDRVGLFVTLDGDKIRIANSKDEFILGIVSGAASIIGDSHEDQWRNMYLKDIYGRYILGDVFHPEEVNEDGEVVCESYTSIGLQINPEYNNEMEYIPRSKRPEWDCVGMLGKLVMNDDGTAEVNGWVKPSTGGIATKSETQTKYRVMNRIDDNHIRILIL